MEIYSDPKEEEYEVSIPIEQTAFGDRNMREEDKRVGVSIINAVYLKSPGIAHTVEEKQYSSYYTIFFTSLKRIDIQLLSSIVSAQYKLVREIEVEFPDTIQCEKNDPCINIRVEVYYCNINPADMVNSLPSFAFKKENDCSLEKSDLLSCIDSEEIKCDYKKIDMILSYCKKLSEAILNKEEYPPDMKFS